jgi:hypothetical protein
MMGKDSVTRSLRRRWVLGWLETASCTEDLEVDCQRIALWRPRVERGNEFREICNSRQFRLRQHAAEKTRWLKRG